jgi:hypothetical protein
MRHFDSHENNPFSQTSVKGDLNEFPFPLKSLEKICKGVTRPATGT